MVKDGTQKYTKIYDDFARNATWQDQLKTNLKIQEDMIFINTPDFNQYAPVKSTMDIE